MPFRPRSVSSRANVIRFGSRVNNRTLRDFVPVLYEVVSRRPQQIVLDMRPVQRAYPEAVLPIICLLDHRRARGDLFRLQLPESPVLRQLFLNSNWAHLVDPSHPRLDMEHRQHLAVRRYQSHAEQQAAVDAVLDIVLRNIDLGRDAIRALEWTINEITDNVLNHAQSPEGGLVQLSTFRDEHKIKFVVADAGRGIPSAMRDRYTELVDDVTAISEAVKAGVTSIPDSGQGNGLAGSVRIATHAEGSFTITSGKAQFSVFRDRRGGEYQTQTSRAPAGFRFPGTAVLVELSTAAEFDISEALALDGRPQEVADVVDLRYGREQDRLVVEVAKEALGVGTRHAGQELRRKCTNLLNAEPSKRLVLDWTGVPLVSSSFADEAVGKLFVDLGPTAFAARVAHAGVEPLVSSLLDRAVLQRVAQSLNSGEGHTPASA